MILDKGVKTIQWGKDSLLKTMVLGKLDIHMQKNEAGPLPNNIHKSQLTIDQTPKCKN